jgi:hypothetical protein
VRTPSAALTILAATGLLCLAAGPATAATTKKPKATKVVLDTWETKEQAATWQKPTWQETQAYCLSLKGAYPPGVCGNVVTGKTAMKKDKKYVVTVAGVVSLFQKWPDPPCGTPAKMPDGTLAGADAQFEFANNLAAADCYLANGGVAIWPAFVWSLAGGAVFAHPTATGKPSAPTADHTYTFTATGHGKKPQFRWYDVLTTDNKGSLTITYRLKKAAAKKS